MQDFACPFRFRTHDSYLETVEACCRGAVSILSATHHVDI